MDYEDDPPNYGEPRLPPTLGPELVDFATSASTRARELRREADQLEEEAERAFNAIKALQE